MSTRRRPAKTKKRAGAPLFDDAAYAVAKGMPALYGKRKLRRLGGAARLSELDEEIQNVLVNPTRCEFKSRNRELLGLQHPSVRIEAAITKILEERGLA